MNRTEAYEHLAHILRTAFQAGASDIHFSVGSLPIMRVDGELIPFGEAPLTPEMNDAFAAASMEEEQYARFKTLGEVDYALAVAGLSRFRVNAYHQRGNVSIAARIIASTVPTLEALKLPPTLTKLTLRTQGLVLVTGPTGSGKSTTLAAMIDYINRNSSRHIITLEDPIEYLHQHNKCIINQREIGYDSQSFANALRAALRQDPDVILVGEMRDPETIATAITAAETGHLVFATLHTSDAPQTIDRIIDSFQPAQQAQIRIQLSSVLAAVISQRLLPRKNSGGRVCATEILLNTPAVANLIRQEKVPQIRNVMQTNMLLGMHTMEMTLKELVKKGIVEESIAKLYLPEGGG